jgi:hypothetical protein
LICGALCDANIEVMLTETPIDFDSNRASSRDLIHEVCQAICPIYGKTNDLHSDGIDFDGNPNTEFIDELRGNLESVKLYLGMFTQKLNHFLYFSTEAELQQIFREVLEGTSSGCWQFI